MRNASPTSTNLAVHARASRNSMARVSACSEGRAVGQSRLTVAISRQPNAYRGFAERGALAESLESRRRREGCLSQTFNEAGPQCVAHSRCASHKSPQMDAAERVTSDAVTGSLRTGGETYIHQYAYAHGGSRTIRQCSEYRLGSPTASLRAERRWLTGCFMRV